MPALEFQNLAKDEPVLSLVDPRASVTMLDYVVQGPRAWTRHTVEATHWTVQLADRAVAEIDAMVDTMRHAPLPMLLRTPGQFELSACGHAMAQIKTNLTDKMGLAVLDGLPLDRLTQDEAAAVYWVLGGLLAMPVATKWDGTMLYDVTDTGRRFGYGVRGSWTNVELSFHTDNAFGVTLPSYVSLLCFYPALEGGVSRFCSLYAVHNELLRAQPRLLRRLYAPAYFDRQAEHAPDAPKVSWAPTFCYDGQRLTARLSPGLIRRGYQMVGKSMDNELSEALEVLETVLNHPDLGVEFTVQRGQIQYLNNLECAHYRSTFTDHPNPALKRHMVRMWYREDGRRSYDG